MQLKKIISLSVLLLASSSVMAKDMITVTVKTKIVNAAAIGFTVDGQNYGSLGREYSGKAPAHRDFSFGYRKDSIFGADISCGNLVLDKNSTVLLITDNNRCISVIQ